METFAEVEEEEEEQEEENGKLDKKEHMPGEWCHTVHTCTIPDISTSQCTMKS